MLCHLMLLTSLHLCLSKLTPRKRLRKELKKTMHIRVKMILIGLETKIEKEAGKGTRTKIRKDKYKE